MTTNQLSSYHLKNNFEKSDRFIPFPLYSSNNLNKIDPNEKKTSKIQEISDITDFSLRDDNLFIRSNALELNNNCLFNIETLKNSVLQNKTSEKKPTDNFYFQKKISDALEVHNDSRILKFHNSQKKNKKNIDQNCKKNHHKDNELGSLEIIGPLISTTSSKNIMELLAIEKINKTKTTKKKLIKKLIVSSILQAPGLRNDFYLNLVSWSKKTNKIAVGLGVHAYLWGIDNNVESINISNFDIITAVSFSSNEYLIVATSRGIILLINHLENKLETIYKNENKCLYCFEWFSNSNIFFAGDEYGEVYIFEIVKKNNDVKIQLKIRFKCHQQQICGIALNKDFSQLAIGSNDNFCSIWSIKKLDSPIFKFILPHNAAIKALSFCPWTTSLLATGGGSRDRKIRFWHTNTGTLLNEFNTSGQITSLIWSKFKKEIVATFGFGAGDKSVLICVYSYPQMIPILQVPEYSSLRILSSTISPDCSSICVATNDSTIRIYNLWKKTHKLVFFPGTSEIGTYGSSLIELHEGITKNTEVIR